MRGHDAPAFGETNQGLALAAYGLANLHKLGGSGGEVLTISSDLGILKSPAEGAGFTREAEGTDGLDAVQIFAGAEAHRERAVPKGAVQNFQVVAHQRGFIGGEQRLDFGLHRRQIDLIRADHK